MQLNVPGKAIAIGLFGVVVGIGLAVAPRHLQRPAPTPEVRPAPAPAPTPGADEKPEWFHAQPLGTGRARAIRSVGPDAALFGWRQDGGHRAIAASLPKLAQAAPHLLARDPGDTRPVLLYKAWTTLFRDDPPYEPQTVGDCVGQGHGHATDLLECIEFALANPGKRPSPDDIQECDTEWIYGASREIAGQLGRFDGSYGAAAVKAMTQWGLVSRRMLGDAGAYDGRRARQWARAGVPEALMAKAARFKLGSAAQVSTWDELVAAISAGHPVTICTGQGFTLVRDAQGFCSPRGTWGHCMFVAGVRFDREGACVVQSWGPESPQGPRALGQPSFSFWVDRPVIERILGEGDSWALSKAPRFGAAAAKGKRTLPESWRKAA